MIDSVCLSQEMHPRLSDRQLMNIGAEQPKGKTAWVINPAKGETMPAIMFQNQPNGIQYLSARFSVPRQRCGHNARLPASQVDIYAGLGIAAEAIYNATGVVFNPLTANVTDVHYAIDFHVGAERIQTILVELESRQLPGHIRIRLDHGVEFKRKQSSIQFYAKYIEVKKQTEKGHIKPKYQTAALQASDGVLRVEQRQHLPAIQRQQTKDGLTRIAYDVLTPDTSHRLLTVALEKLQFAEAVNSSKTDLELDRLIQCHGARVAIRLAGFLQTISVYGRDFWRILDYPKRTYYDNLRLCKNAGVWT